MKLLHTSDWHLGAALYDAPRYEEHKAFLGWLTDLIASEHIDALLVAGDIFGKVMPPNDAAGLYYSFLAGLGAAGWPSSRAATMIRPPGSTPRPMC